MEKLKNIVLIILAAFLLVTASAWQIYKKKFQFQKAETERVSGNYRILQSESIKIKGENGLLASRVQSQELTLNEFKTYYQNLVADVSDMKISLRKVAGITAFNTETTNNFHTFFRDSLVKDTVPIEYLNYHSDWLDLEITKQGKDALIKNASRDSLITVLHWDYSGKFWLTRFLTEKEYWQDIKSMNPNSRITYSAWIEPVKNKRSSRRR